jgi:PAS domain S-box-containing protein
VKKRRNITRPKKAKINEILTDASQASSQLHGAQTRGVAKTHENLLSELSELRTRFSGMVVRGPVPFIVIDSDGYIREVNDAACQLLGYSSTRLTDLAFSYVVAPKNQDLLREHLRRCQQSGADPAITNLHLRTADKRVIAVQLISNFFHRQGADHYQTAIIDETSLHQRAQELKDARDFAENIVQTIRQPLVVLDETMGVVTANRAFMRVFNLSQGQGIKNFIQKLLELRVDGHTLRERFGTVLASHEPAEDIRLELPAVNGPLRVRTGEAPRTLLISAQSFYRHTSTMPLLLVSIEDITKQQQAEAALRREQMMLARAEALAHVGGWEWRIPEGEVIWSDELYNIFGVDRHKFKPTYQAYLELIHPDDREYVDATIRKGMNNATALDFYHRIWRNNEIRTLHCQGYFALDAHRQPVVLMGIAQDVTELRKVEEQLRGVNHELEERSRSLQRSNEEMQAFSYSIAHDLRAPLRAIQGMSRILMEDFGNVLDEDGQDYFGRIMDAAQRMDDLIRDLLDYARMTTVQLPLGPVDTEAIWSRVIANFATEIKDKDAVIDKNEVLPCVRAHRTVVELALSNLLGNALKFFPKGGKPHIKIWTQQVDGNRVRFHIQDKGIGIAPEHQQRIFRVFERLHPTEAYPGTGIGLAIVKKGIERVGGTLGLDSKPGDGSTFWFELETM